MSTSTRWTVAVMVVVVALGVALWTELGDDGSPAGSQGPGSARDRRDADTAEALAGPRERADLRPCPSPGSAPGPDTLRGITLECAGDGSSVDVAKAVAGRTVVLNLWRIGARRAQRSCLRWPSTSSASGLLSPC